MKIGIVGHGFVDWAGGRDFLRLIGGSLAIAGGSIDLHFILPIKGARFSGRKFLRNAKQLTKRALGRPYSSVRELLESEINEMVSPAVSYKIHLIDIGERALNRCIKENGIEVIVPAISPINDPVVPWVGYLYDYQHAYYPSYFSKKVLIERESHFSRMLSLAKNIIVNARAVEADIGRFNPGHTSKVFSLPFAPAPDAEWLSTDHSCQSKYGIDRPFFLISNQFWKHKDHATAWKAFSLFCETDADKLLVCTGTTHDPRDPMHFDRLMVLAKELGITTRLRILGLIPKSDQIALLKSSIALVQPTLFEGGPGGGAVYDAVSLGVQSLVSDIPVNTEIVDDSVSFFRAGDADSLFRKMKTACGEGSKNRHVSKEVLVRRGVERRIECGKVLMNALNSALSDGL